MDWIFIALIAPAAWAAANHIDKYLLSKHLPVQGIGVLLLFSSAVGPLLLPVIWLVHPHVFQIAPMHALILVTNGVLYIASLVPYFMALQRDEASFVVPLFQITAVFSYVLGLIFLDEQLTLWQGLAAGLIVIGSVLLSLQINRPAKRLRLKRDVLLLMLAASLMNALNWLLFKFVAIQENFWVSSFWEYVGFAIFFVAAFGFIRPVRQNFMAVLTSPAPSKRRLVVGFSFLNEGLSTLAKVATNWASLSGPLALISAIHGLQPAFVFGMGILLTLFVPLYGREDMTRATLTQKIGAIMLTISGVALLARA